MTDRRPGGEPLRARPDGAGRRPVPEDDPAARARRRTEEQLAAEAAERDRLARRRFLVRAGAVAAAVVVLGVVVAVVTVERGTPPAQVVIGNDAFGADGTGLVGAADATYSPDGTLLAVLRGRGSLGIARSGAFQPVVPEVTTVVAYAWLNERVLLLREGPSSTGTLVAVGADGSSQGSTRLTPDLAVGPGLAVSPDRGTAALVVPAEGTLAGGPMGGDLYLADVRTGTTRQLTSTPDDLESDPVYLDAGHLAVTLTAAGGSTRVAVVDTNTGATTPMPGAAEGSRVLGVLSGARLAWTEGETIRVSTLTGPVATLGSAPAPARAVAIDPTGTRVVVRDLDQRNGSAALRELQL